MEQETATSGVPAADTAAPPPGGTNPPRRPGRADAPSPGEAPPTPSAVELDARGLRALAHPVRIEIVGLLRRYGPSTATLLAARLGLNSGATSYHLRRLAAAGFVEDDVARGNARERWWRASHATTVFDAERLGRDDPTASEAFLHGVAAAHAATVRRALAAHATMPPPWRAALDMSDRLLRLTPDEARALEAELSEVIGRYRRHDPQAPVPEGTERVSVITLVLPDPEAGP